MFATERGRKIFFSIMLFSWVALFFPWIYGELYGDRYFSWLILPTYLPVVMAILIFICIYKWKETVWSIWFSVLAEVLLISIPILCFWPMMLLLYMNLKHENIVSNGLGVTFINWVNLALVCIPIFAFPILSRWKGQEMQ